MPLKSLERLLEIRYPLPEWVTVFELNKGTGFRGTEGRADVVAYNCYPSKGLHRFAFECKRTRSDFMREVDNPQKRKWLEDSFHQTYFVVTPGIIDPKEVPEGWGLLVATKKGDCLRRKVAARHRELKALPESIALSTIRSLAQSLHEAQSPVNFDGQEMTKDGLDKLIGEKLQGLREDLYNQEKETRAKYRELQTTQDALVEPFKCLTDRILDWSEQRDLRRNPAEKITVNAVNEWIDRVVKEEFTKKLTMLVQARDMLDAILKVTAKE